MKTLCRRMVLVLAGLSSAVATKALAQNEFGPWRQSSCFSGIDERTRMTGEVQNGKHKWIVELRNRYQQEIGVSMVATESYVRSAPAMTDRLIIGAGGVEGTYFWLAETQSIMVFTSRLTIGGGEYQPCDR